MVAGRPREFDYEKALEKAMRVFWTKGFEGTSMPDLTKAMGMNRPSIYAAFGNKEELFKKSLDRYSEKAEKILKELLDVPTITQAIENLLITSANSFSCKETPKGCLVVQGALIGSEDTKSVCRETLKRRELIVNLLNERLEKAVHDKELPANTNTLELARFFATVLQGMSIQSVGGTSGIDLKAIAKHALMALPQ